MMLTGLSADFVRFPIVVCRLGASACPHHLLQAQCAAYVDEAASHRGIFVCVHDWTAASGLGAPTWALVFEQAILTSAFSSRCVAQAVAVSSPELRAFATARTMARRDSYALRVADSFESALSWSSWQLKRSEPQAV